MTIRRKAFEEIIGMIAELQKVIKLISTKLTDQLTDQWIRVETRVERQQSIENRTFRRNPVDNRVFHLINIANT